MYSRTNTGANRDCPGAHDFHISLRGEASQFLIIVRPSTLTGVGAGETKATDVAFNMRSTKPEPHNNEAIGRSMVEVGCEGGGRGLYAHADGNESFSSFDAGITLGRTIQPIRTMWVRSARLGSWRRLPTAIGGTHLIR